MKRSIIILAMFATSAFSETIEERVEKLEKEVAALKAIIAQPKTPTSVPVPKSDATGQVEVTIANKVLRKRDFASQVFESSLYWDATFTLKGAEKSTRAIKGSLIFMDLFDEPQLRVGWTITEPLKPGVPYTEERSGIKYNQFTDSHKWLKTTELKDMKVRFEVESIIYAE
ncbi:hypothetical protein OAG28_01545 [Akkermansiaceae bacterium]|nr:hypothetical protein [Akkermansiaceae bacterium]